MILATMSSRFAKYFLMSLSGLCAIHKRILSYFIRVVAILSTIEGVNEPRKCIWCEENAAKDLGIPGGEVARIAGAEVSLRP